MKNTLNILLFLLAGALVSDNCDAFHGRYDFAHRAASRNTQNMSEMNQGKQNKESLIDNSQLNSVSEKKEEKKGIVKSQKSDVPGEQLHYEVTKETDAKENKEIKHSVVEQKDDVEMISNNGETTSNSSFEEKDVVTPDERITLRLHGNVNQQSVELTYAQVKTLLAINTKDGKKRPVKELRYSAKQLNRILCVNDLFKVFGKNGNGKYIINVNELTEALDKFNKDE